MFNRLPQNYIIPPSIADKALAGAYGCKIEVLRFPDDDADDDRRRTSVQFELTGHLPTQADAHALLAAMLAGADDEEGGQYV